MPDMRSQSRGRVLGAVAAGGVLLWFIGVALGTTTRAQEPANFRGGAPTQVDATAIRTLRLRFPAGTRSNWHRHSHGQLLMSESGKGRTQTRGGAVTEVLPGQPWFTGPNVEHWHGATPDQDFLQLTIGEGTTTWLEPVADDVYRTPPRPR
jgi:quercetin dioxygenase-like cupin family protein